MKTEKRIATSSKKLTFKSCEVLEIVWEKMYKPFKWIIITPIHHKWSWKYFRWVYEMEMEIQQEDLIIETVVDNKSEINTKKMTFTVRTDSEYTFRKIFYVNPNAFKTNVEFEKWSNPILALNLKKYNPITSKQL